MKSSRVQVSSSSRSFAQGSVAFAALGAAAATMGAEGAGCGGEATGGGATVDETGGGCCAGSEVDALRGDLAAGFAGNGVISTGCGVVAGAFGSTFALACVESVPVIGAEACGDCAACSIIDADGGGATVSRSAARSSPFVVGSLARDAAGDVSLAEAASFSTADGMPTCGANILHAKNPPTATKKHATTIDNAIPDRRGPSA